jgi:sugar-specific transcriptional regulator TrmB
MDHTADLMNLGLTDKEARAYMVVLQFGSRPTTFIAQKAKLNRGTAHITLHALLEKGLLTKTTQHGVQYFMALPVSHLVEHLDRQQREICERKQCAERLVEKLQMLIPASRNRPKISIFEGREGARNVMLDTLTAKNPVLKAFISLTSNIESIGAEFLAEYTRRRIKGGYTMYGIQTLEINRETAMTSPYARTYQTSKRDRRFIRVVGEELSFPVTMYLYDTKVGVMPSANENFSMIVESPEFFRMQDNLFELMWKSLPADSGGNCDG